MGAGDQVQRSFSSGLGTERVSANVSFGAGGRALANEPEPLKISIWLDNHSSLSSGCVLGILLNAAGTTSEQDLSRVCRCSSIVLMELPGGYTQSF